MYKRRRIDLPPAEANQLHTLSPSSSGELPDEILIETISRVGTLDVVVRCSSLLSTRWRNAWRSIPGGVLDFDKSDELRRMHDKRASKTTDEEKRRFTDRVDQTLASLVHHQNLDALKIGFDMYQMEEGVCRWIEFGLTKRVRELTLLSYSTTYPNARPSLCFLTPEFLTNYHDLSRLEVLEFRGVDDISQAAVDHILSNYPSLRQFVLHRCHSVYYTDRIIKPVVIRVDSSNSNLECLDLGELWGVERIELISAPRLHTFKLRGNYCDMREVEFGSDLTQLQATLFSCRWWLFRWSPDQFSKFIGPRVERLGLEVISHEFMPHLLAKPKWLSFEKLRVLDLFMYMVKAPSSFLECTTLLSAAPMLCELSIWFKHIGDEAPRGWETRDLGAESHPSLEVLQLYGVHPNPYDFRNRQLKLAAYIIMNAPSLRQVLIDTRRHRDRLRDSLDKIKFSDSIDAHIYEAKMELETQLQGRSASPHINFTYR